MCCIFPSTASFFGGKKLSYWLYFSAPLPSQLSPSKLLLHHCKNKTEQKETNKPKNLALVKIPSDLKLTKSAGYLLALIFFELTTFAFNLTLFLCCLSQWMAPTTILSGLPGTWWLLLDTSFPQIRHIDRHVPIYYSPVRHSPADRSPRCRSTCMCKACRQRSIWARIKLFSLIQFLLNSWRKQFGCKSITSTFVLFLTWVFEEVQITYLKHPRLSAVNF